MRLRVLCSSFKKIFQQVLWIIEPGFAESFVTFDKKLIFIKDGALGSVPGLNPTSVTKGSLPTSFLVRCRNDLAYTTLE